VKSETAHSLTRRMKVPLLRPLKSLVTRRLTSVRFVPPSCDCERRHHDVVRDLSFGRKEEMGRHWSRIMASRSIYMIHSRRSFAGFSSSRMSRVRMNAGLFHERSMMGLHITLISFP
jgi:hypothetical protein